MISLNKLTDKLIEKLSNNTLGLTFSISTDTGVYQKDYRKFNTVYKYCNGLHTSISSTNQITQTGTTIQTLTTRLDLTFKCKDTEKDVKQKEKQADGTIENVVIDLGNRNYFKIIRGYLDSIFSQLETFEITDDDKNYIVSVSYTIANTGLRQMIENIGDFMSYYINCFYNIIETGENSQSYRVMIDGLGVPYSAVTIDRLKNIEQDVYANSKGNARATVISTMLTLNIELAGLKDDLGAMLKDYLLSGKANTVHFVEVKLNDKKENYLMCLTSCPTNAQSILNVGRKITLVESNTDYEMISFTERCKTYKKKIADNPTSFNKLIFNTDKGELTTTLPTTVNTIIVSYENLNNYSEYLEEL